MARVRIGVDIGATAVRAAELKGSPASLVRVGQVPLPVGAVNSGVIRASLDGREISGAPCEIALVDDGRYHYGLVTLG